MRASALQKGLAVLDLIEQQGPRRFGELRALIGVSEPTLSAVLKLLEESALIRRVDEGYGIGRRGLSLARGFLASNDLTRLTRPVMSDLGMHLQCRCELGEPQGDHYLVLDVRPGPDDPPLHADLGQVIHHLIGIAPAKLCLAHLGEAARRAYYASEQFYQPTPHTMADIQRIETEMAKIRASGYAEDHEEGRVGIVRLSAAIKDHEGRLRGCLSIVLHKREADAQRVKACAVPLRAAAGDLSHELGYQGT